MSPRNVKSSLRARRHVDPMRDYDSLPLPLRRWLSQARLPWSPRSARKTWARALSRHQGDAERALAALDRAEARMLSRDIPRIWGADHPALAEG
ncbi:DUF6525 family protein [Paracoccus sp. (in: a-proteobacteria)]|uniref:DUF6525 family protein n=1 Tax=Paracoccus sp. TaxID=267 RepID=UPI00272AF1E6|nr:DUF6525 family protein [Paracoccus sp. (in: a-proteobacteria)]